MFEGNCQENNQKYQELIKLEKDELVRLLIAKDVIIGEKNDQIENITYELYWHEQLLHADLSDKEKVNISAYMFYASQTEKREDDSFYYSLPGVARIMGGERAEGQRQCKQEQRFAPVHTALQRFGYITTAKEPQKGDKTRNNYFDTLTPTFLLYPELIKLVDHSEWGGRVAIHKNCGGECTERVVYLCTKCGEDYLKPEDIYFLERDEHERRVQADEETAQNLPTMAELDSFETTASIGEMRELGGQDAAKNEEFETTKRAMESARRSELGGLTRLGRLNLKQGLCDEDWEEVDNVLLGWKYNDELRE